MQRPLAGEYAAGYQEYFDLVPQGDYLSLLKENTTETTNYFESDGQSKLQCNIVTHPMTARAIGYFLIGHVKHHINIIEQRY